MKNLSTFAAIALAFALAGPLPAQDEDTPAGGDKKEEKKKDDPKAKKDDKKDGGEKKDEKKEEDKDKPDDVDNECLEGKTLAGKLHVPANWRPKSGTVDLFYTFAEEPQLLDWKVSGADKTEIKGGLELGIGSDAMATCMLEGVELAGDFELEVSVTFQWLSPQTDFAILVGQRGSDAIGIRFGDQYVKVKKGKLVPITKNEPSKDKFALQKLVDLKIVRKGDELKTWINKMERPAKKLTKKELDGKVGFLVAQNARLNVSAFKIRGVVDKSKL